jgi:hypothetical protein
MGDQHYLDTPIWKDIVAGLATFRSISKVTIGNGLSTSFWFDLWLGDAPLCDRFPVLYSHSFIPNACVSLLFRSGIQGNLGPRLSRAASADLLSWTLQQDIPDHHVGRLNANMLSNKCFYVNSFRHQHVDRLADRSGEAWLP